MIYLVSESPGGFSTIVCYALPSGSDSIVLKWGWRICISKRFPYAADAAGPGATLGEPVAQSVFPDLTKVRLILDYFLTLRWLIKLFTVPQSLSAPCSAHNGLSAELFSVKSGLPDLLLVLLFPALYHRAYFQLR